MTKIVSVITLALVLLTSVAAGQTTTTTTTENPQYLVLSGVGFNRQTDPAFMGFVGVGIRVASSIIKGGAIIDHRPNWVV